MSTRALGACLDVAFRRGVAVGADTTWDSHVRVWIGQADQREHVEDFDIDVPDDLTSWLTRKLDRRGIDRDASDSAQAWTEMWSLMQRLFDKEIDTGFQTDPSRQQITAWIGNEYYGHLAERTFKIDELKGREIDGWLADASERVFQPPAHSHRKASSRNEPSYR
jgi:hypothetical protein